MKSEVSLIFLHLQTVCKDPAIYEWHIKTTLKINYGIYYHQTRKHSLPSLTQLSPTQSVPPLCFPSSSSVCRRCGSILWADWAVLLSSTCLLNDSNYFPGLQATHACFISTSTSPICLHGDAWHTRCWNGRKKTADHFISLHTFLWVPTEFSSLRSFIEGARSFMVPGEILQGLTDVVALVSWWSRHR